jgi:hypothetical protein
VVTHRCRGLLTPSELERAVDAASYLGASDEMIDGALRSWRDVRQAGTG